MTTERALRILVVDDQAPIRALLARALQEKGYDVVALNDGLAGLEAVLTATEPYDLVVTNNCMPRMGGDELIARIRDAYPTLPILHLDDGSTPHALLPTDVLNLTKPFTCDSMVEKVDQLLLRADKQTRSSGPSSDSMPQVAG